MPTCTGRCALLFPRLRRLCVSTVYSVLAYVFFAEVGCLPRREAAHEVKMEKWTGVGISLARYSESPYKADRG